MGSTPSRLEATQKFETRVVVSYSSGLVKPYNYNRRICSRDTYFLRELAKLSSKQRRQMIDVNYRLRTINNTLLAILLQRLRTDRDDNESHLEIEATVMRSLLQDLIYLLNESKEQTTGDSSSSPAPGTIGDSSTASSSSSAAAAAASPHANRFASIREREVHAYCQDDTDEFLVPITLLEAICRLPYDEERVSILMPELIELLEYALTTSTNIHNLNSISNPNFLLDLLFTTPPQENKVILPLIMVLRKDNRVPLPGLSSRFWHSLFSQRSYEQLELFLNWILLESDPSVFPIDCPTLIELIGDEQMRHYDTPMLILGEIIEQLREYRRINAVSIPSASSLSSSSNSSSSLSSCSSSSVSSGSSPALLSLHSYVHSTLDSLPARMFSARTLRSFVDSLAIAQKQSTSEPDSDSKKWIWPVQDMHDQTKKLCQAIEEEYASVTSSGSSSSSSSSSSVSSVHRKRVIRLSEICSSTTLLHCLFSCPTVTLTLFDSPEYPHAREWFMSQLNNQETKVLICNLLPNHPIRKIKDYTLLQLMLIMHRPSQSRDFIYQIYESLLEMTIGLPLITSHRSIPTRDQIAHQFYGGGMNDAYRHLTTFLVRPSRYMSFAQHSLWNEQLRQVRVLSLVTGQFSSSQPFARYHVNQVRLILDLFARYNLIGDVELKVDFFSHFLVNCNQRAMSEWIECTRDTTETLWPHRLEEMNQTVVRFVTFESQEQALGVAAILSTEAQRWYDEVWPKYESMVEEHLIRDVVGIVVSYLSAGPPLAIHVVVGDLD